MMRNMIELLLKAYSKLDALLAHRNTPQRNTVVKSVTLHRQVKSARQESQTLDMYVYFGHVD